MVGEKILSQNEDSSMKVVTCGFKHCPSSSFTPTITTDSVMFFLWGSCFKYLGSFGMVNPENFSKGRKRKLSQD